MKLLFRREQTTGRFGRVRFKLWSQIELDPEEQEIVKRYRFDEAELIEVIQPGLLRNAIIVAFLVFLFTLGPLGGTVDVLGIAVSVLLGCGAGWWYFDSRRETIFVRDLIHGRHFSCRSVIELARKEAFLEQVVAFLRQVMESAKTWDGTDTVDVPALPKAEAKYMMLKGL